MSNREIATDSSGTLSAIRFIIKENGDAVGQPSVTECMHLMEKNNLNDTHRLVNMNDQMLAVANVEHDYSIDNLVFMGDKAFKYTVKDDVYDFTANKNPVRSENVKSNLKFFLRNREYLESINEGTEDELLAHIDSRPDLYEHGLEDLAYMVDKANTTDSYNVNEAINISKEIVTQAADNYQKEYGSQDSSIFTDANISQVVMKLVKNHEDDHLTKLDLKVDEKSKKTIKNK
jgi:hypothetical protein